MRSRRRSSGRRSRPSASSPAPPRERALGDWMARVGATMGCALAFGCDRRRAGRAATRAERPGHSARRRRCASTGARRTKGTAPTSSAWRYVRKAGRTGARLGRETLRRHAQGEPRRHRRARARQHAATTSTPPARSSHSVADGFDGSTRTAPAAPIGLKVHDVGPAARPRLARALRRPGILQDRGQTRCTPSSRCIYAEARRDRLRDQHRASRRNVVGDAVRPRSSGPLRRRWY